MNSKCLLLWSPPSKHRGKHTKWEYSAQIPKYVTHELFSDTQEKYENKQRQDITEKSLIKDQISI